MTAETMPTRLVGQAIKRREDPQLITGQGSFLDDIKLPGMTHACVLRSPYAHAKIKSIDTSKAKAHPGVVAVFTGEDMLDLNPLPCAWQAGRVKNNVNTPRVLAVGEVHFAGDPVALVIAEDRYIARDACDLIEVEYEPLPVVVDAKKATEPGAPQLHENAPNNIVMEWDAGDKAKADAAIAAAEVVVREQIINQRLIPTPMETRGAIARYEQATGEFTLWTTSQAPHVMRLLLTAFVFGIPETKLRVISPNVGGGFGQKIFCYNDMAFTMWAARKIGRPVKFVEDRSENYKYSTHGRDHITDVEIAGTRDGAITGLRVTTYANLGAYLSTIAPGIPTTLYGRIITGVYRIPAAYVKVYGVYTNTAMVDAYRGAGRPEASYLIERMVDRFAAEIGMDPAEVRRKNFIPPDAFPYDNGMGLLPYDSGNYEAALNKALDIIGYANFRKEQEEARKHGRYLGLGISSYVEICGVAPSKWIGLPGEGWGAGLWESANVRIHLTGKVVVTTGSLPHGQGVETTFAQIVADELGVPYDDVVIEHSDTAGTPFGYGTYGSRSLAVGGTAVYRSVAKIKEKAKKLAAHMLEANPDDMVYENGRVYVKGSPDRAKTLAEIALQASVAYDLPEGMEPFLDETSYYDPPNCTFPFGTHIAIVEVDPDTGIVDLKRYVAVDDCGNVINPLIVDGQIHGGIAQGVAQALYERAVYDENGQLVSGTLMDYAVPAAHMLPPFETDRTVTPSPVNPMGVKGAGEAGTIASAQAVMNAVIDALSPFGVKHMQMPATPENVWKAIRAAQTAS
ncbi:xanthine dehydrogenase family protein molybdopterin-binding subunit [Roseiflexus castenholzii]|jgi:carbon-monoxide dehydrogenase large subunit|uniref:Aldehyde oxidase and xanthine dehydrogenase molybdopterin binding n=1 Tax=Roseiflexus castenholzii (strain DSM 13941 / HLO8) TaxID=383372 RepID=A7NHL2_ROSCS|nr:molybdopterin cofactor-binding domain-containing protein [Roseiflexus castenholzii]ABU56959.1 aldehyde oxidase and xanthine dehydrogenase molybdopterin binding [Roseiflexus castenholzii DSM 13941]